MILTALGIWFFSTQGKAEAGNWYFWTTDEGSAASKNEFSWNEQPYSYFFVDKDFFDMTPNELDIKWQWFYTDEQQYEEHYFHFPWSKSIDEEGNFRKWESPQDWLSIKKLGDWSTKVVWKAKIEEDWTGYRWKTSGFTVTPEPVSSLLFLVGGTSLALVGYNRRKRLSS